VGCALKSEPLFIYLTKNHAGLAKKSVFVFIWGCLSLVGFSLLIHLQNQAFGKSLFTKTVSLDGVNKVDFYQDKQFFYSWPR
jgi:hypothetical protein